MVLWLLEAFSGLPADELTQLAHGVTLFTVVGLGVVAVFAGVFLGAHWQEKKE